MNVPMSMTMITSKVLQSQQATSTLEALRNVSGVSLAQTPQGLPEFSVRGFSETSQTTNGIADRTSVQSDVATIERIEVLKGPQAILAGGDSLGGGVNVVIKRPTTEAVRDLTLQYGSRADVTATVDLAGALTDDKRWSYRFIGTVVRSGITTAGYLGRSNDSLMPAVRYKDGGTDLTLSAAYTSGRLPMSEYTLASPDGKIMPTPQQRLGSRSDGFDNRHVRVGYELEQTVSGDLTLVSRMHRVQDRLAIHLWSPFAQTPDEAGAVSVLLGGLDDTTESRQYSGDHYARLRFDTGPVAHKLALGFGHENYRSEQLQYEPEAVPVQVYPPVATQLRDSRAAQMNPYLSDVGQQQRAVYVQDLLSYGDWNLLLNLRRTRYHQTQSAGSGALAQSFAPSTIYASTPGAGVVYRWSDDTSLYASYSEGFVPQTVPLCAGGTAPPVQSKNKEIGAKFQLAGGRLSLTSAVFEIDQSNSPVFQPTGNCVEVFPARKTQGLELDVQGDLAPGWSVVSNYTYAKASDALDPQARITGSPRHKFSLWTTYQPLWEKLPGLGAGLGLTSASRMAGNSDALEPFDIPAQTQMDASVFYEQPAWSLKFGIKNLTNRRLYGVSVSNVYVPVLPGRSFMLTVQRRFN
ncbi:hypothetical protein DBR42_02985 [Pelomonas sp. HMWF004]|nr:hypothetical protein DBR42_02985 [Pelomonas sp. HMWF004]